MPWFDAGARGDRPLVVHDRVWTAANAITLLRLAGLPLFVWLMLGPKAYGWAFFTLVVVACTDWIDGYVARRFDQVTRLGRFMDPLIDRVLLATAAFTLLVIGFIPWYLVVVVVGRDLVLLAGAAVLLRGLPTPPVTRLGKFATASLLIGVPGFLVGHMDWAGARLFLIAAWCFTVVGVVAYYLAGAQYAAVALRMRRLDMRRQRSAATRSR